MLNISGLPAIMDISNEGTVLGKGTVPIAEISLYRYFKAILGIF